MSLKIRIDDSAPPYEQVRAQISEQARSGALPVGYRLPTVRGLAESLGLAVNTVAKAYRALETDGVIETRGRNGTFVAAAGSAAVRVVACGHPPPVLLHGEEAREVAVAPGPPLGIGLLDADRPKEVTVPLGPGDRLFLASDGVWEARDAAGTFYPLPERLAALAGTPSAELPGAVWADLLRRRYVVRDDATVLVLAPEPPAG
ncbi:SpoIIE family protein phosphatase [Streptomyces tricolor]|uniref:SpoIIE family protein phosphatase n=1 Tax=Streptomyces tricolor TaxID=68277 RepID=UPI000A3A12DB|nr:SpoIIE family protein phosphatase [Streptomyces tricolor]